MLITKEVITLSVPFILLVRTYDLVQLILYVGCSGIIDRKHHGSIRKNYVQRKEKDDVYRPDEGNTSGVYITAGTQIKTSPAFCQMKLAYNGQFVEKL
jgi:hypothetical protein